MMVLACFNCVPSDVILDWSNLKAFADDKIDVVKMTSSLHDRVENAVGKGENAGYQHFLLFPQCFPKPSSLPLYHTIRNFNDPEKEAH